MSTLVTPTSPHPLVDEQQLLDHARHAHPHLRFEDLTTPALAEIARAQGVDFATALLHDRLRSSPAHGPFIRQVELINPFAPPPPFLDAKLLIAPAAFYRQMSRFGGDGAMVRKVAAEFDLPADLLPVSATGSVTNNAAEIAAALEAETDNSVILASLSKGGADVRIALENAPHLAKKIRAWLNVCGLVRGSPISDSLLGTRWWQRGLVRGYLAYTRADAAMVAELAATPGSLLARPVNLPPGLRVISILGFPLTMHLAANARTRHARMAPFGPNDGSTLLRDSILEPGHVIPVWGADHFMRTPEVETIFRRLFIHLARPA